jgi:thiol:disulfide interchange protein/DsbC/DsbD-like thiol-disulfide interchange protein
MKVDRILPNFLVAYCVALCLGPLMFGVASTLAPTAFAQGLTSPNADHVKVDLISPSESVAAGSKAWIGLRMRHDPHWHTYWKNPGDSGLPTQFELKLPPGVKSDSIHWPKPERIFIPPLANYGYENEVVLSREIELPANFPANQLEVQAKVSWLVCKDVCIPGEAQVSLTLPVKSGVSADSAHRRLFENNWARVPKAELSVQASASADKLSLLLPANLNDPKRVEFFATSEETIVHPAPQALYKLISGGYRLDIALATDKKIDFSKAPERAGGVLDVDGQFYVLNPLKVDLANSSAGETGTLVASLAGAPERSVGGQTSPAEALRLATGVEPGGAAKTRGDKVMGSREPSVSAVKTPETGPTSGLLISLGAALLGGLILNLMPCVFPVIGLKLMGFAGQGSQGSELAAESRRRLRVETVAFASGVVLSFLTLGALMLFLRSAGQAVGWGFQLQSPMFVGAMVLLFVALGLNFAGLFEIGLGLTQLGNMDQALHRRSEANQSSVAHPASAFLSGVLAVLVATPCTAPFMGSALGFSLAQPASEALLVFAFLGLGMALPYLLLAVFPAWLKRLPRPGRWMESFKQFLAFPMFAAAIWLLWVFGLQTSSESLMRLGLGSVALAFTLWLYGRFIQGGSRLSLTTGFRVFILALMLFGAFGALYGLSSASEAEASKGKLEQTGAWRPWSEQAVKEGLAQGRPVFVDFTAAWCVSCQANKKLVLETETVLQTFAASKTLLLKADWTKQDPLITAELNRHGRSGVPLYLVYLPGQALAKMLPEILTQSQVLSALAPSKR